MKAALLGGKNKQNQTHTNTLETKTIRVKSWRDSLNLNARAPAIAVIVAGFFMLTTLPGLAVVFGSEDDAPHEEPLQALDQSTSSEAAQAGTVDTGPDTNIPESEHADSKLASGSSSSINISMSVSSSSDPAGDEPTDNPEPTVTINGQTIELPKNNRFNETIEDENGKTRVKGRINTDGGSSISISTDFNNSEGD